ncbi:MAG: AMP-binding protein, partial [Gammaproteobacteria bacterium]|nr:ATP-dependent acyl-CoA ligase [Gemmatimonadota bacterium]NIU73244.1 AMP-binding protein [Gammaproteobacteria bacterium]
AARMAAGLRERGVEPGDHVALMLSNGPEFLFLVFALARLGAVAVPLNVSYKGDLLVHALRSSDACVLVAEE